MSVQTTSNSNTILTGSQGTDVLSVLGTHDLVFGLGGNDVLSSGPGGNLLFGGDSNDLLFTNGSDALVSGGNGVDVAILRGSGDFTFNSNNLQAVEGIQGMPQANDTVTVDSNIFNSVTGNHFTFAFGGTNDAVRILTHGTNQVTVQGDHLLFDNHVVIDFSGVQRVTVIDTNTNTSSVYTQFSSAPSDSVGTAIAGPGSAAARAAALVGFSHNAAVQAGDLSPLAPQLSDIVNQVNTPPTPTPASITQTAEVLQSALGGTVNQFAQILQSALAAGAGSIDQSAVVNQVAHSLGTAANQVASVVQDAVTFGLGHVTQNAAVNQGATGGQVTQSANIQQSAFSTGGTTAQSAFINQSAAAGSHGSVSQGASVVQFAESGGAAAPHFVVAPLGVHPDFMMVA